MNLGVQMSNSLFVTARPANKQALYRELKNNLTAAEIEQTGIDLRPGSDHPRAWVGPPYLYDKIGGVQFQLLLELGLREHHRFLDVGCGSLRLGRLAIMYLLPNRYFGVEPNKKILREGCKLHFGAVPERSQLIKAKAPSFAHNDQFDFSFTGEHKMDFVFAQSIASHTGPQMTRDLLSAIASVMHDESVAMVTFIKCGPQKSNTAEGWFYPECVAYSDYVFGKFCSESGLHAYRCSWPTLNMRDDGLISTQQPTILTKNPWKPGLAQRLTSALLEGIVKIN